MKAYKNNLFVLVICFVISLLFYPSSSFASLDEQESFLGGLSPSDRFIPYPPDVEDDSVKIDLGCQEGSFNAFGQRCIRGQFLDGCRSDNDCPAGRICAQGSFTCVPDTCPAHCYACRREAGRHVCIEPEDENYDKSEEEIAEEQTEVVQSEDSLADETDESSAVASSKSAAEATSAESAETSTEQSVVAAPNEASQAQQNEASEEVPQEEVVEEETCEAGESTVKDDVSCEAGQCVVEKRTLSDDSVCYGCEGSDVAACPEDVAEVEVVECPADVGNTIYLEAGSCESVQACATGNTIDGCVECIKPTKCEDTEKNKTSNSFPPPFGCGADNSLPDLQWTLGSACTASNNWDCKLQACNN